MDELALIEKMIAEVVGVISLQHTAEASRQGEEQYEKFPEPEDVEEKPKVEGDEEDEDAQPEPVDDDEEEKKPVFKPEEFKWTITNGRYKNLLQLFGDVKSQSIL